MARGALHTEGVEIWVLGGVSRPEVGDTVSRGSVILISKSIMHVHGFARRAVELVAVVRGASGGLGRAL